MQVQEQSQPQGIGVDNLFRVCMIDGVAHFAQYYFRCAVPPDSSFDADGTGIFVYTDVERERIRKWLAQQQIEYVEEIIPPSVESAMTNGVKYTSRSEILAHIQDKKPPASLQMKDILTRLEAAEQKVRESELKIASIESVRPK